LLVVQGENPKANDEALFYYWKLIIS